MSAAAISPEPRGEGHPVRRLGPLSSPPTRWVGGRKHHVMGRFRLRRETLREDAAAGLVLGVQSVPDGLATGLLAGVNPVSGLYGYLVGTIVGATAASSAFMVVQGTGAMAMVIADVPRVHGPDGARALFTLSILTGIAMLAAGLLRLGAVLRFVSNAVMVGFINAVGSEHRARPASEPDRVCGGGLESRLPGGEHRALAGAAGLGEPRGRFATIGLIILLERTRVGALGLVVAVVVTSGVAAVFGLAGVATLDDLGVAVDGLPTPVWPSLAAVPALIVPGARADVRRARAGRGDLRELRQPRRHLSRRVP